MTDTPQRKIEIMPGLSTGAPLMAPSSGDGFMLPGVNLIGRGVDVVNGEYAYFQSTLDSLFDIKDRIGPDDRTFPERANAYAAFERLFGRDTFGLREVEPLIGGEGVTHTWSGNQVSEVQSKAKAAANVEGSYYGFSGEVGFAASSASAQSASAYFCNKVGRYPKYVLRLKPQGALRDLLKPQVREALDSWDATQLAEKFFPIYGGYFLQNAVFGGSMNYSAVRRTTSTQSESEFEVSMQAAYDFGVGKASGSTHVENGKKAATFFAASDEKLRARGGTKTLDFGQEGGLAAWQDSLIDAPDMIDFDNGRGPGCCPVWTLVDDPARAELIRNAFFEYALAIEKRYAFHDPSLRTLHGFADWSTHDLRRWFYSMDANHKRGDAWKAKKSRFHVYPDQRPGCRAFYSLGKKVTWKDGIFDKKKVFNIYKISTKKEGGWNVISTFYAPTAPLNGTLDTWKPIYEYTRNKRGKYCGKHYNLDNADVGIWKRAAKPLFYAVVK